MSHAARIIHVEPDSELGQLLDEVGETDAAFEKEGVHYRVSRVNASSGRRPREPLRPKRVLNIICMASRPRAATLPVGRMSMAPTRPTTAGDERAEG